MIKIRPQSLLLLLALSLGACAGERAPIQPRAELYSPQQIHVDSEQLRKDTAVGRPEVVRDNSGLLHITVPIRSAINQTLYVDYWVTFFDDRRQVLSKTFGGSKTLQANTPDSISFTSMSPRAADFQLDLRYSR